MKVRVFVNDMIYVIAIPVGYTFIRGGYILYDENQLGQIQAIRYTPSGLALRVEPVNIYDKL